MFITTLKNVHFPSQFGTLKLTTKKNELAPRLRPKPSGNILMMVI